MSEPFDVIVVGGGHNGLVAAGLLARRGARVTVLERRSQVGGGGPRGSGIGNQSLEGSHGDFTQRERRVVSPDTDQGLGLGQHTIK